MITTSITVELTIDRKRRELLSGASELKVLGTSGSGERSGCADSGPGCRDDVGAVDQVSGVMAEESELVDGGTEALGHELLLVDEALPEAGSAGVAGEDEVGLQAHFADVCAAADGEGGRHFTSVVIGSGEADTREQSLQEELGVECEGSLKLED